MAAVHSVQDGPGGDPVLGSSLSILSSMSGLLAPASTLWLSNNGYKNKQFDPGRLGNTGTVQSLSSLVSRRARPDRAANEAFLLHVFLMTPWAI